MPYITKEEVAEIRTRLKKEFPKIKFSITRENGSSIRVSILSAPINMLTRGETYETINPNCIDNSYTGDVRGILTSIVGIMDMFQRKGYTDGDYGYIPSYYTWLSIGQWNKPFIVK